CRSFFVYINFDGVFDHHENVKAGHICTSLATSIIYFIPCIVGMMDLLPDQVEARNWVLQEYTCAKSVTFPPKLQIFTMTKAKPIIMIFMTLDLLTFLLATLWVTLSFHFIKGSGHLSQKTKQMQKRFLLYLCFQVAIPVFSMMVPVFIAATLFMTNSSRRGLDFACIVIGTHGCVAAIMLIMCNEPYRKFATSFLTSRSMEEEEVRSFNKPDDADRFYTF
uniref:G protein-coupled receptor n=1 Tax=Haemonchus contortus TaxID=6289 RepID=A0A7I5E883_HAECO